MSRDRGRSLSLEDRILWSRVAGSTDPLPGRSVPSVPEQIKEKEAEDEKIARATALSYRPAPNPAPRGAPGGLDRMTRRKLDRGRLPIEGKVDLHGLIQREAHGLLLSFLHRAHADGRRHVLVVTGKGSSAGSEGALRRAVPQWLATAPFRGLVSGFEGAARRHGGEGAIYVRLRRREAP